MSAKSARGERAFKSDMWRGALVVMCYDVCACDVAGIKVGCNEGCRVQCVWCELYNVAGVWCSEEAVFRLV